MRRKAERKTSLMCEGAGQDEHPALPIGDGSTSTGTGVGTATATATVFTHATSLAGGNTSSLAPSDVHAANSESVVTSTPKRQRHVPLPQFPPWGGGGGGGGGGGSSMGNTLDTDAADMLIAAYCKAHGWPRYRPLKGARKRTRNRAREPQVLPQPQPLGQAQPQPQPQLDPLNGRLTSPSLPLMTTREEQGSSPRVMGGEEEVLPLTPDTALSGTRPPTLWPTSSELELEAGCWLAASPLNRKPPTKSVEPWAIEAATAIAMEVATAMAALAGPGV